MINMSDRIKKLARKMEGILPYPDTLQHLYDNLGELMFQQRDYFEYIDPTDRVKLLFYVWSLKLSKDFAIGEDLLNRISFAHLFYTEGNRYIETCDECGGNGDETRLTFVCNTEFIFLIYIFDMVRNHNFN